MNPEQLYDQAQRLLANKQHNDAYKILKKLDATIPNHPGILYLLAACQSLGGHKESAIKTYQRVLKLQPNFVEAMNNIGLDLKHLQRHRESIEYFDKALAIQPDFFDAKLNKASTLLAIHEDQAASDLLMQLLRVAPEHPMALANLGTAHLKTRNPEAALTLFTAARRSMGNNLEINRGYFSALSELKRWTELIEASKQLPKEIVCDPRISEILFTAHLQTNDWEAIQTELNNSNLAISPFDALCVISNPKTLMKTASRISQAHNTQLFYTKPFYHHPKLKIGYISSDFKSHPISILTNNLFNAHDKEHFEIHAIAIDKFPPPDNKYRKKIAADCDSFHEVGDKQDCEAIEYIRQLELDVLIDLNGYTQNRRTNILASRCAPVQMQYLGFPGTMGASFIDYTIGDPIITPVSHYQFYSEKIISLPECFQVNDDQRLVTQQTTRILHSLQDDAFVFACFNQHIKITHKIFDSWLQILRAVPKSVIWLVRGNPLQESNLLSYAQSQGVGENRFVFAEHITYDQHLGRYALADIVLDTYPFNGGTTTSDALWGGAPVITLMGDTYASRMAASLLHSVGLDELVTKTPVDYEQLAIALASDSQRLYCLRQRLRNKIATAPAFSTKRFVKHLEMGLTLAVERHRNGLKPDHLLVPLLD